MSVNVIEAKMRPASAYRKVASYTEGELKRYDIPDKTVVMLMAIVADESKIPVNELRFISIREVED